MEGQSQQETKQQETSILCGIHLFKLVEIKAKQGLLFLLWARFRYTKVYVHTFFFLKSSALKMIALADVEAPLQVKIN